MNIFMIYYIKRQTINNLFIVKVNTKLLMNLKNVILVKNMNFDNFIFNSENLNAI